MPRDPKLQRSARSNGLLAIVGISQSAPQARAGCTLLPSQHPKLVLHFVCELSESSMLSVEAFQRRRLVTPQSHRVLDSRLRGNDTAVGALPPKLNAATPRRNCARRASR